MSSKPIIDRSNYESYFLDFLEGRLEVSMQYQLRLFLLQNPDLADQLDGIQNINLTPDNSPAIPSKAALKKKLITYKDVNEETIDEKLVTWLEGEMGPEETADLHRFIELNPAFQFDLELYKKTILEPDATVIYPEKQMLRRSALFVPGRRVYWVSAAVAAVLIIFLGWRVFLDRNNPAINEPGLAWHNPLEGEPRSTLQEIAPLVARPIIIQPERKEIPARDLAVISVDRQDVMQLAPLSVPSLETSPEIGLGERSQPASDLLASTQDPIVDQKNGIFIGKLLYKLGSRNRDRRENLQEAIATRDNKVNFWSLADLGVKGYNKLADRNIEMEVVRNGTGEPKEYTFTESGRVLLSRPANQQ